MCTATATLDTKRKIFEVLDLDKEKTFTIEKSPGRSNLVYSFQYIDNDMEIQNIFNEVISEVRKKQKNVQKQLFIAKQGNKQLCYGGHFRWHLEMLCTLIRLWKQEMLWLKCSTLVHQSLPNSIS